MWYAGESRDELRRRYLRAWQRRLAGQPLDPLDAQISDVIALHPEYHPLLESEASLHDAPKPAAGDDNPFLHLGLHLALREQLATRRPAGIESVHARLARTQPNPHTIEHRMMEVLADELWQAQRAGRAPDESRYLARLRRL
jgi:hypothetical protein